MQYIVVIFSSGKPFLYHEDFQPRKPPVPARTEKPLMGICSKMDFVKSNVIKNKMAVPRKPQPACAHTRHGDKQVLQNSGLVPQFIKKKVSERKLWRKVE